MSENCYLCNNRTIIKYQFPKTNAGQYDMLECDSCGFLRIDPIPEREIIDSIYTEKDLKKERREYEVFSSPFLTYLKKIIVINPLLSKLRTQLKELSSPKLLDIGCSTGWITSISKDAGFDVLGLEANSETARYGSDRYDIEIMDGYIEDLDIKMKFSAVTMFHILEHLTDPKSILVKVHSHLNNSGKLLIVLPNSKSLGIDLFGSTYSWNIPDHISFFSPDTVTTILKNTGFKVNEITHLTSPPLIIYSFNNYMKKRRNEGKFSFSLTQPILANSAALPFAFLGKLLNRGEVMAVYAEKV